MVVLFSDNYNLINCSTSFDTLGHNTQFPRQIACNKECFVNFLECFISQQHGQNYTSKVD